MDFSCTIVCAFISAITAAAIIAAMTSAAHCFNQSNSQFIHSMFTSQEVSRYSTADCEVMRSPFSIIRCSRGNEEQLVLSDNHG